MIPTHLIIGLKNIRRNPSRSIVTIFLGTFSTMILIYVTALMDGMHGTLLKNAVEIYPSYIQITHKEFKDNPSLENIIDDSDSIVEKLRKDDAIDTVGSRFETFVLLSSDNSSTGAMISGIEPKYEEKLSKLKHSLYKGEYLSDSDTNAIYIGYELAKRLKVDIGDTISFVGTGADYSFCADNLIVKGIYQTGLFDFDASSTFINKKYFDQIFVSQNLSTHIVILPKNTKKSLHISNEINNALPKHIHSQSWQESMSSLVEAMELDTIFGYITIGIFFIVIFFVIVIYTMLNIFSRIKEIGILRAIGTSRKQILQMLVFESSILSTISVIIGGILGAYIAYYYNINPIQLGAEFEAQFKQYGLVSSALPTDFNPINIIRDMVIMFFLCVLSTLYPILKANNFKPIEAIHHV